MGRLEELDDDPSNADFEDIANLIAAVRAADAWHDARQFTVECDSLVQAQANSIEHERWQAYRQARAKIEGGG